MSLKTSTCVIVDNMHIHICMFVLTGLPFNGALVSSSPSVAWLARNCSKPCRQGPAGGAREAWVLHAAPDWSNARRDMPKDLVSLRDAGGQHVLPYSNLSCSYPVFGSYVGLLGLLLLEVAKACCS